MVGVENLFCSHHLGVHVEILGLSPVLRLFRFRCILLKLVIRLRTLLAGQGELGGKKGGKVDRRESGKEGGRMMEMNKDRVESTNSSPNLLEMFNCGDC